MKEIVVLKPTFNLETYFLNNNNTSWIKLKKLDNDVGLTISDFEQLWSLKPNEKLQINKGGRIIDCPRYSLSYLKSYHFSGLNHKAELILPTRVQQLLDSCRLQKPELNQSQINWYEYDGSIGKHSDDTRQLIPNSEIYSLSFGPARRLLILEPKDNTDKNQLTLHIELENNTLLIMGGQCQVSHYHSVLKKDFGIFHLKPLGRRINITFRCFK